MIAVGASLYPEQRKSLHEKLGRELPEIVYAGSMTGHRVLIAPEPISEKWSLLYKPRATMEREQLEMGVGWVINVGPLVGALGSPHPVGIECDKPEDLLGKHVYYRSFSGTNLKTSMEDTEYGGQWSLIILTDRDILFWDGSL